MKEIRIITDQATSEYSSENAHFTDALIEASSNVYSVSSLKKEISKTINDVIETVDLENLNSKGYDVKELTFNLNINKAGEVSLLSCLSGGISTQSGITITIVRKEDKHNG